MEKLRADSLVKELAGLEGIRVGLWVHLGCGNGRIVAAMARGGGTVAHGVDTGMRLVTDARAYLRSKGLSGAASVDLFAPHRLP